MRRFAAMASMEIWLVEEGVDLTNQDAPVLNLEPDKEFPIAAVGDQIILTDDMESGSRAFLVKKRSFVYEAERLIIVLRVESVDSPRGITPPH